MKVRQLLGDIAQIRAGYTFRTSPDYSVNGDTYLVQASDIDEWVELTNPTLLKKIKAPKTEHSLIVEKDILIASRGRFHATYVKNVAVPIIASSSLFVIKNNTEAYLPHFIAMYLNTPNAQQYFTKYSSGSNIKTLLIETIKKLPIPKISKDEQTDLLYFYNSVAQQKSLLERKQELLQQIFTTTMSKALKGATA